jgi:hypothetical protein
MKFRTGLPTPWSPRPSRRQILTGAGAALASTPLWARGARAAGGSPMRLVCWPLMNGALAPAFYPSGDSATALSLITEPLRKYANLVTFIKGVNIDGATNHQGVRSTYSGFPIASFDAPDPTVKSIDQLVADQIDKDAPTAIRSLHLGVIPADSINYYQRVGRSTFFFAPRPVDYEANPVTAFDRVFGGAPPSNGPSATSNDFTVDTMALLEGEMTDLTTAVGMGSPSEVAKLSSHRDSWNELKPKIMPTMAMMSGTLPSVEKLRPTLLGNPRDAYKSAYYSDMFDAQVDIMAKALVTGMTRVATLQAGSADNNLIDPVDMGYPHHITSHGDQNIFNRCQQWYFTKLARFAAAMDVPDPLDPGGKTVLQNTILVMIAECLPVGHESVGVPALLLGTGAGKFKPGYVVGNGITNKNIMATVASAFGVAPQQFGNTTVSGVLA